LLLLAAATCWVRPRHTTRTRRVWPAAGAAAESEAFTEDLAADGIRGGRGTGDQAVVRPGQQGQRRRSRELGWRERMIHPRAGDDAYRGVHAYSPRMMIS
jgi:hypothetical protein